MPAPERDALLAGTRSFTQAHTNLARIERDAPRGDTPRGWRLFNSGSSRSGTDPFR